MTAREHRWATGHTFKARTTFPGQTPEAKRLEAESGSWEMTLIARKAARENMDFDTLVSDALFKLDNSDFWHTKALVELDTLKLNMTRRQYNLWVLGEGLAETARSWRDWFFRAYYANSLSKSLAIDFGGCVCKPDQSCPECRPTYPADSIPY